MKQRKSRSIGCGCLILVPFLLGMLWFMCIALSNPHIIQAFAAIKTAY